MRAASSAAPESQKPVPEPKKPLTITQAEVTLSWLDVALSSQILELLKDPNNVIAYLLPAPAIVVGKYEDYVIGYLSNFDYAYVFINGVVLPLQARPRTTGRPLPSSGSINSFARDGTNSRCASYRSL
jgi:hypothetical protein